jgi:hypothetical protein
VEFLIAQNPPFNTGANETGKLCFLTAKRQQYFKISLLLNSSAFQSSGISIAGGRAFVKERQGRGYKGVIGGSIVDHPIM